MLRVLSKIKKIIYYSFNLGLSCNYRKFICDGGIIGNGCEVFPDVEFGSEPYLIEIGNNVRITYGVKFITHDGGLWTLRKLGIEKNADMFGKIIIGDNSCIGWNSIIMPGVKIGKNCIIGACSTVTKDIPDNSVAVGNPAQVIESIDEYYEKNKKRFLQTKNMNYKDKKKTILKELSKKNSKIKGA